MGLTRIVLVRGRRRNYYLIHRGPFRRDRLGALMRSGIPPGRHPMFRVGLGQDSHRFSLDATRPLVLGGIAVPGAREGTRFQTVGVSELNALGNPARPFVFTNADGSTTTVVTPDPGRALITGVGPKDDPTFEHMNAFKISPLRGVRNTAPYFHDNSAKTLEDVVRHYALFFSIVTNNTIVLSEQDQADIVAFMKLL
jgi:hypothetical protein